MTLVPFLAISCLVGALSIAGYIAASRAWSRSFRERHRKILEQYDRERERQRRCAEYHVGDPRFYGAVGNSNGAVDETDIVAATLERASRQ